MLVFGSHACGPPSHTPMQVIDTEKGKALADEYSIKFLETSAKNSINVEEAFITLAKDIKKRLIDTPEAGMCFLSVHATRFALSGRVSPTGMVSPTHTLYSLARLCRWWWQEGRGSAGHHQTGRLCTRTKEVLLIFFPGTAHFLFRTFFFLTCT